MIPDLQTAPPSAAAPVAQSRPARIWPFVALAASYWAVRLTLDHMDLAIFARFMLSLLLWVLLTIPFLVMWLVNRRIRRSEKWVVLGAAIVGGAIEGTLWVHAMGVMGWLLVGVPVILTAWAIALLALRRATPARHQWGLIGALMLTWACFSFVRVDGLSGEGRMDFHWRWTPSTEELYLAQRPRAPAAPLSVPASGAAAPIALAPGDWPAFRGPDRDGIVHGVRIATDWNTAPPRLLWKQRIGPGWSSMTLIGDRVFTQEQQGDSEAVVCFDARNGQTIWAHLDRARFWDAQGGTGPRATPTFANGRIYSLGATGILNCLDAGSGALIWSHNIATDSGANPPIWGFASSPLVIDGVVVVFAGGAGPKQLLAYHDDSGQIAWSAQAGPDSYTSPQAARIQGAESILFYGATGLLAIDPSNGKTRWSYPMARSPALPRTIQPHVIDDSVILANESNLQRIDVTNSEVAQRWNSRVLKPSFNDFVVHDHNAYGFDGSTFTCVDLSNGSRRWRHGRYGNGQVILLADPGLLLILSEEGEMIMLRADPGQSTELGRFSAVSGKAWASPAVAHGRLLARSDAELAAYELKPEKPE